MLQLGASQWGILHPLAQLWLKKPCRMVALKNYKYHILLHTSYFTQLLQKDLLEVR